MKKTICLTLILLSMLGCLTACDTENIVGEIIVYDILGIPVPSQEVNNADVFMDGSYTQYDGGEEAKAFFDKYVNLDGHKDFSFKYRYVRRTYGKKGMYLTYASGFVVDVYYEESDFYSIAHSIIPDTDEDIKYTNDLEVVGGFFKITQITNEDLPENSLCSVMFDKQHHTIRYVFIYDIYDDEFVRGVDDDDDTIKAIVTAVMAIDKWNGSGGHLPENPDDWIFDYSDIIDIESSEESEVE